MAAAEPIRDKKQLREMAEHFREREQFRNYALIVLGAHTALRISDLLRLTWEDVYDADRESFRTHLIVTEKKTGKHKMIALHRQAKNALALLYPHRRGPYLFANSRRPHTAISRVQAYRIIRAAAEEAGIAGTITCHSLRKMIGYHSWKNGVSPVLIMQLYGHSSYEITKRYLGINQDEIDQTYLTQSFF